MDIGHFVQLGITVFYVYIAFGFSIFGVGMFLIPGWFKVLWVAACFAFVAALPTILEKRC